MMRRQAGQGCCPGPAKGADGPFDPIDGWGVWRGQLGPINHLGCPLQTTHPLPGFQGPTALGGVEGQSPRLATGASR